MFDPARDKNIPSRCLEQFDAFYSPQPLASAIESIKLFLELQGKITYQIFVYYSIPDKATKPR